MARFPDLRIDVVRSRLPMRIAGRVAPLAGRARTVTADRRIDQRGCWTRSSSRERRLPADSGGTVWDLHPLPWSRRADVGCLAEYSMPRSMGLAAQTMNARVSSLGLADIADKLDAGVRLSIDDGVRLFECPGSARARLAREPRAREAARRADVLQLQSAARSDERLRRELPVLFVRAPEARRRRRVHDAARAGLRQTAAARESAAHRNPRRQRPASRSAVFVLHGHAQRAEGDSARHPPEVLHRRRDRVLRRDVRHDRRAGAARAERRGA